MPPFAIKKFLQQESAGGIVLFFAAILAMIWANSSLAWLHQQFIHRFLFTINDGLMAVFFLFVGLELRRSYQAGDLSNWRDTGLPLVAAIGGMIIPAVVYCAVNIHDPALFIGWATPVATDIAFVMGVLSLFGRRVPLSIKLFLLSLAIFDDIGAILIIALFYTDNLSLGHLAGSAGFFFLMLFLREYKVENLWLYIILGILLWLNLWLAGINPAIAGVLLALALPSQSLSSQGKQSASNLSQSASNLADPSTYPNSSSRGMSAGSSPSLEERLHPWVAFVIMPLFALANAGFSLQGLGWDDLLSGIVLGVALGLFIGKQLGVFLFSWVLIKLNFARLPASSTWRQLYGASVLCGIGFTMSLFLGTLSFSTEQQMAEMRLGVLLGSALSGLLGAVLFRSPTVE